MTFAPRDRDGAGSPASCEHRCRDWTGVYLQRDLGRRHGRVFYPHRRPSGPGQRLRSHRPDRGR
jgi:hypothetical protein